MIPQNLDVWAWEKYYKQASPSHAASEEVKIVTKTPASRSASLGSHTQWVSLTCPNSPRASLQARDPVCLTT